MSNNDEYSLAQVLLCEHTKWDCKYHIVFSPKFRKKEVYGELRTEIEQILRMLCDRKGVEMIEANACSYTAKNVSFQFYEVLKR